jgi:hypothetical protein
VLSGKALLQRARANKAEIEIKNTLQLNAHKDINRVLSPKGLTHRYQTKTNATGSVGALTPKLE